MILSVVAFVVTFTAVFGLCIAVARKRDAVLKAKQESTIRRVCAQQVTQTKKDDIWRANKRLIMR